jgi:hypothetical protein
MDPRELPQIREWMGDDESFYPPAFVSATGTVAAATALLMIAWPEFVEYRGCVFVKWKFKRSNADHWFDELDGDGPAVEGVVNHLHFWDVFPLEGPEEYRAASAAAVRVAAMWKASLRDAFPGRKFDVILADEPDDYGPTLTFRSG